ncbi:hypothetical protein N9B38_02265 [bacterium]|nr:hypothetical protein [bacterium]
MKVKLNIDLDIELTEGGKRIQLSDLWETAQIVAANAAQSANESVSSSAAPVSDPESVVDEEHATKQQKVEPDRTQETSGKEHVWQSQSATQSLHPLGMFLCDLLDRVVEVTQQPHDPAHKKGQRPDPG